MLNISLRFPVTAVPAVETTYICRGFYLPNDTNYHVIGSTPIIGNSDVLHHMLLYACRDIPGVNVVGDFADTGCNIVVHADVTRPVCGPNITNRISKVETLLIKGF